MPEIAKYSQHGMYVNRIEEVGTHVTDACVRRPEFYGATNCPEESLAQLRHPRIISRPLHPLFLFLQLRREVESEDRIRSACETLGNTGKCLKLLDGDSMGLLGKLE